MCVACEKQNLDWKLKNGERPLEKVVFYKIFKDRKAIVELCFVHSRELFQKGELRFLEKNLALASEIANNPSKYSRNF